MRKAVLLAIVAVTSSVAVNAFAQHEEFAYTPENRWVFDSLNRMMGKGLLVGFRHFQPQGDPHQAQTREVFAMAAHAAYRKLQGMIRALQQRIDDISLITDRQAALAELEEVKEQVRRFHEYDEDICDLIKLSRTFSRELQALGVNILAMRRELSDLRERTSGGYRYRFAKDDPRFGAKYKPRS